MDSLNSEGITFKRPTQNPSKNEKLNRKRKSPGDAMDSVDLDILRTFEGPSQSIPRRLELYSKYLEVLKKHLSTVQEKYNHELDESLDKFIRGSFDIIDKNQHVLPIGILESGLSAAENSAMFDHLQKSLCAAKYSEKTRIQSGTSSTTKAKFQKICGQILYWQDAKETDAARKDRNFSLYDLKSFLASEKSPFKIAILVEDVEYFPNTVVTQLLQLIGCSDLPVVFVFGATHGQFINNLVPLNSSTEFLIDKFYSVTPKDRLNDFMRRVLFDSTNPFKISGRIASYLESHYEEDNFSVDSLFNSINFCLRHHFLSAKSAFCSLNSSEMYSKDELDNFKRCLETESQDDSPRKRPKTLRESSESLLASCMECLHEWNFCLRLVSFINLRLRDFPLGETYARIYNSFCNMHSSAGEENGFHKFLGSVQSLSKNGLEDMLADCIEYLKTTKTLPNIDLLSDASSHFQKLSNDLVDGEQEANKERPEENTKTGTLKLRKRKLNLRELQNSLLEDKRKNDGTSAVHTVRTELVDYLKNMLKKLETPQEKRNFFKIFMFDDVNHLISAMFPASFLQLQEDITRPNISLKCECCSSLDSASIVDSLPDVSIIYKLISEHTTRKVDLNLIYNSFVGVVQIEQTGRKSKAKLKEAEAATTSYLVRFRRAVGELQHMGFLRRSKSKPDEINRLVWW